MSARIYNKFYVNKNNESGSEKIVLGYQNDGQETILNKDKETFFHIPAYTTPIELINTSLIRDGATGGSFPAISDRIYKSLKNFGNSTNHGSPILTTADGTWMCSWLYNDGSGNLQWMDRYYNPGQNKYTKDYLLNVHIIYESNDPIFTDVPSTMTLEPGVFYKYVHVAENKSKEFLTTLGGVSGERLLLNLTNWGTTTVDQSNNKLPIVVRTTAASPEVLYETIETDDRMPLSTISFNNSYNTEATLDWSSTYAATDEFSLTFWAYSENWEKSQTTQLVGNFSAKGGVGVFIDTLSSYPFFVLPETTYGHLLFINQKGTCITDKFVNPTTVSAGSSKFVVINSDNHVVVCKDDSSGTLFKMDHVGNILCSTKYKNSAFTFTSNEQPNQMLCGENDSILLITNSSRYYFDSNLNFIRKENYGLDEYSVSAYKYRTDTNDISLITKSGVQDFKCSDDTEWSIDNSDRHLYKNGELFAYFEDGSSSLQIDPHGNVWVLHGTNNISVLNPDSPLADPILAFNIGTDDFHLHKNCSFMQVYNRDTLTTEWKAMISYSNETYLYILSLDGKRIQTINVSAFANLSILSKYNQDLEQFSFNGRGDFTGYDFRRIFKKSSLFNNQNQLIIKATFKDKLTNNYSTKKCYCSIGDWEKNSWKHITVTLQRNVFKLYVNGQLKSSFVFSGRYELTYEQQPYFLIGSSQGNSESLNREIKSVVHMFNGNIGEVKIFNYALDQKILEAFLRAVYIGEDMYWSMPIPDTQYLEKIDRMFKNKLPGTKSGFFNINLFGTKITDTATRKIIEDEIKSIASQTSPAYCDSVNINWIE